MRKDLVAKLTVVKHQGIRKNIWIVDKAESGWLRDKKVEALEDLSSHTKEFEFFLKDSRDLSKLFHQI